MRLNDVESRPQIQVKGVAEHDLGADGLEVFRGHRLDRSVGSHGHERRCLDRAAREFQTAAPRRAVLCQ